MSIGSESRRLGERGGGGGGGDDEEIEEAEEEGALRSRPCPSGPSVLATRDPRPQAQESSRGIVTQAAPGSAAGRPARSLHILLGESPLVIVLTVLQPRPRWLDWPQNKTTDKSAG